MSALPSKQTFVGALSKSVKCHKRTPAVQQRKQFDHLVCKCEKIGRNGEAGRLGGFQIQRELSLLRLLGRRPSSALIPVRVRTAG
jgi:hypothetical protein